MISRLGKDYLPSWHLARLCHSALEVEFASLASVMRSKPKRLWIAISLSLLFVLLAAVGWSIAGARKAGAGALNENPLPEVAANAISGAASGNLQGVYRVQKGDTLYGIATKHKVSVSALRKANQDKDDMLAVGELLVIPQK